jgi:hypothetical protein
VTLLVAFALVALGAVYVVAHFVVGTLPTADYTHAASGGVVNVVLQETPENDSSSKPDWVSYYVMKPGANPFQQSSWVHTTLFSVPANTRVNMTIYGYDGCTPPRNNFWSEVRGRWATSSPSGSTPAQTSRRGRGPSPPPPSTAASS